MEQFIDRIITEHSDFSFYICEFCLVNFILQDIEALCSILLQKNKCQSVTFSVTPQHLL